MAKNNLIPTQVVDKNGRATTVYKSPLHEVSASAASNIPQVSSSPQPKSTLLNVPPLSSGEVVEFLAFHPETIDGTHAMFRSLSGKTQAMLWWARQMKILDDDSINTILSFAKGEIEKNALEERSYKQADNTIRSTLLIAELIKDQCRFTGDDSGLIYEVRQTVVGYGYRGDGAKSLPPVFSSVEEMLPVAGLSAYAVATTKYVPVDSPHVHYDICHYSDEEGLGYLGRFISNPFLLAYVADHPESGYQLGKFVAERYLGDSEEDAQAALEYLVGTVGTVAVSEGWL